MSSILLIRHAQSANNAQPEHLRVCDPGITEIGVKQARATASALGSCRIDSLYCSPFLRSLETAKPISELLQIPATIRADLFEEGGCYSGHIAGQQRGEPGMGRSQLQCRYPNWPVDDRIQDAGWWGKPYETTTQAIARAVAVKQWIEESIVPQGNRLNAMVIHADFKRHLLLQLLGSAWAEGHNRQLGPLFNTGLTLVERIGQQWVMHSFNAATHLHRDLWTA